MIGKLTAYGLIILANIILLAHAVIPHHHHESVICIEQKHCQNDTKQHKHNVTEHDHQHNDNKNSTTCILKQSFVVPTSQGKYLKTGINYLYNPNHDCFLSSNFGYSDLQAVLKIAFCFPERSSSILSFVTSSLGLRAPPSNVKC